MFADIHNRYTEDRILSASPLELIQILYDLALDRVEAARLHLAQGKIEERTQAITKILDILAQLILSLNTQEGGAASSDRMAIYHHLEVRLLKANAEASDEILAEVEKTFQALSANWRGVAELLIPARAESHQEVPVVPAAALASPFDTYYDTHTMAAAAGYETRNWSL